LGEGGKAKDRKKKKNITTEKAHPASRLQGLRRRNKGKRPGDAEIGAHYLGRVVGKSEKKMTRMVISAKQNQPREGVT